jgi:ribosomal protein S8E
VDHCSAAVIMPQKGYIELYSEQYGYRLYYHEKKRKKEGLLDRKGQSRAKVLSNMIKQKQKEKVEKWEVPLPKVRAQGETEVLKVIQTGKREKKAWKRMVTNVCSVGDGFTRKPPKYERFIRPMGSTFQKSPCHTP